MRSLARDKFNVKIDHKSTFTGVSQSGEPSAQIYQYWFRATVEPRTYGSSDEYFSKDMDYNYVMVLHRTEWVRLWGVGYLPEAAISPGDKAGLSISPFAKTIELEVKGVSFTKNIMRVALGSRIAQKELW
jgi:hypothetical protein|nr:MAG TPA: hypothetical protein [Caudoviricetes sp.]